MLELWRNNSGIIHKILYKWRACGVPFEDLRQEAYLALLLAVKRYKADRRGWAFTTILTNTLHWYFIRLMQKHDYLEKEFVYLNAPATNDADCDTERIDLIPADIDLENEIIEQLTNSELGQLCVNAINGLPKDVRQALTYRFINLYPVAKTAELMHRTPEDVRRHCECGTRRINADYKLRAKLRQIQDEERVYSFGARNVGLRSFTELQASNQELYILWLESKGALRAV